jgi:hypothetical protein
VESTRKAKRGLRTQLKERKRRRTDVFIYGAIRSAKTCQLLEATRDTVRLGYVMIGHMGSAKTLDNEMTPIAASVAVHQTIVRNK